MDAGARQQEIQSWVGTETVATAAQSKRRSQRTSAAARTSLGCLVEHQRVPGGVGGHGHQPCCGKSTQDPGHSLSSLSSHCRQPGWGSTWASPGPCSPRLREQLASSARTCPCYRQGIGSSLRSHELSWGHSGHKWLHHVHTETYKLTLPTQHCPTCENTEENTDSLKHNIRPAKHLT